MKRYKEFINESISEDYSRRNIDTLPNLPEGIEKLYCYENNIKELPKLPKTLKSIDCACNELSNLPELPDKLEILVCYENKIRNLPKLPDSIKAIDCSYNILSYLPTLPDGLFVLNCYGNPLKCLIPNKFINDQDNKWLEEHYYPMIKSYEGQKAILSQDEKNITELLKQTNGYIDPKIKEEYPDLFHSSVWGLIS